jgi:peptide/nickel transport system substrate-binding protein
MKHTERIIRSRSVALVVALTSALTLTASAQAQTAPKGTLTAAVHTFSKETLDPSLDSTVGLPYRGELYDWFIGATPDGKLTTATGVLESYKPNADATQWTFTLKQGPKWHDGQPITSADIKFTIEYYMRPEAVCTACGVLKSGVAGVDIVDARTAVIKLKSPDVTIPAVFSPMEGDILIVPKHYIEKVGPAAFAENPMGSGPWKLGSRRITQFIEYKANTDYWDKSRVPGIETLRLVLVPESRTRLAMLRRGEVDMIPIEPQDTEALKKEGFKIFGPKYTCSTTLLFWKSYDPAFLSNKLELRKALTLAVDWAGLFKALYPQEVAEPYRGGGAIFTPLSMGFDPSLAPYKYDVEEAKRLLKASGYNGEEVRFWSFASFENPEQKEVNEVIAGYWRAIGVNVKLLPIDFGSFVPRYVADPQKFDPPIEVAVMSPIARPSTIGNLRTFMISHKAGGRIWTYWNSEYIDGAFKKISGIVDDGVRAKELQAVNQKIYNEYWAIPIALRHFPWATRNVARWEPTDGTPLSLNFETLKRQ